MRPTLQLITYSIMRMNLKEEEVWPCNAARGDIHRHSIESCI